MSRCSGLPTGARPPTRGARGRADLAPLSEPRRLSDGSIDYDLYRALARRLRRDFVAQTTSSLMGRAIRVWMLLAAWIVAPMDNRTPQTSRARSDAFRSRR